MQLRANDSTSLGLCVHHELGDSHFHCRAQSSGLSSWAACHSHLEGFKPGQVPPTESEIVATNAGTVGWGIQGYKGIGVPTPLRAEVVADIDCVLSRLVELPQHFAEMPFSIPSSPGGRPLLL